MFVTCGIASIVGDTVTIANAAATDIYQFWVASGFVRNLGLTGFPVGLPLVIEDQELCRSNRVELEPGDLILFTSDDVDEAVGENRIRCPGPIGWSNSLRRAGSAS